MSEFSQNAMSRMREIAEASTGPADCAREIKKHLNGIKHEVFHANVLVATYISPAKSRGGILFTDKKIQEDKFQGNCFLVLDTGPLAFKDDGVAKFGGATIKKGDWVLAIPGDGQATEINSVPCRIYSDTRILMKVDDPSKYY